MTMLPLLACPYTPPKHDKKKKQPAKQAVSTQSKINDFTLTRRYRFWEVRDPTGELVCITVYKCGGQEVIKRLREKSAA